MQRLGVIKFPFLKKKCLDIRNLASLWFQLSLDVCDVVDSTSTTQCPPHRQLSTPTSMSWQDYMLVTRWTFNESLASTSMIWHRQTLSTQCFCTSGSIAAMLVTHCHRRQELSNIITINNLLNISEVPSSTSPSCQALYTQVDNIIIIKSRFSSWHYKSPGSSGANVGGIPKWVWAYVRTYQDISW